MAIVGFHFTKIKAERKGPVAGKVDIKNNVAIIGIKETSMELGSSRQTGLTFEFEFSSDYEPKVGDMHFSGELLYMGEQKKQQEIIDEWKKSKKVSKVVMSEILNAVLSKCNIEGLILSRDINLPPPIPLPKVGQA